MSWQVAQRAVDFCLERADDRVNESLCLGNVFTGFDAARHTSVLDARS